RFQNRLAKKREWRRFGYSKSCALSHNRCDFIMLRAPKFSGMHLRFPKPRARHCSLPARMDAPKLLRHNWRECIGNRTASLFVTVFFTTTNRRDAEKTL